MRIVVATGTLLAAVTLAACTSSGPGPAGTGAATTGSSSAHHTSTTFGQFGRHRKATPDIIIDKFVYKGQLTVPPGAKVTVINEDATMHTVTDERTHKFDTGTITGNGGIGTFVAPTKPGRYPFGCTVHPSMHGVLIVKR